MQLLLLNAVKDVASNLSDLLMSACTAVEKSREETWDAFKSCKEVSDYF